MTLRVFYKTAIRSLILLLILQQGSFAADTCKLPLKIAVLDTGLSLDDSRFADHLCKEGHWNFVTNSPKLIDEHGHGTHVTGLIQQYAGKGDYCFLIYKYYSDANPGSVNLKNTVKAINYAAEQGASIINYSGGGPEFVEEEYLAIKNHPLVTFIVAAGNDHSDIDVYKNYYPAYYRLPNEIIAASLNAAGTRASTSNWATKTQIVWEVGDNVLSTFPGGKTGYMSGTSQATAIHTGKVVAMRLSACNSAK